MESTKKCLVRGLVKSSAYNDFIYFEAGTSSVAELVASRRAQYSFGIMQSLHCNSVSSVLAVWQACLQMSWLQFAHSNLVQTHLRVSRVSFLLLSLLDILIQHTRSHLQAGLQTSQAAESWWRCLLGRGGTLFLLRDAAEGQQSWPSWAWMVLLTTSISAFT